MALSKKAREYLTTALANPDIANEIGNAVDTSCSMAAAALAAVNSKLINSPQTPVSTQNTSVESGAIKLIIEQAAEIKYQTKEISDLKITIASARGSIKGFMVGIVTILILLFLIKHL
jgi:hypothetical protein